MSKLTEAQIRAQQKYDAANRERRNYTKQRSSAKTFIRKATAEDFVELEKLIKIFKIKAQ